MDKLTKGIIIGLIIGLVLGLVIGGVVGYFLHNNMNRNFTQGRGNFQIDENTKNEITSFFETNTDMNTISSYCEQNRVNCLYYCRSINPNHEICKELGNYTLGPGGRQWNQ
jgi:Na+/glutamate symporter